MHLRLAFRRLAATPTFTVAAIALLALGTGATLAVYTVLNALVLKTLPVHDPDQLVAIEVRNARDEASAMTRPLFDAVSQRQHSLVQVTGVLGGSVVSAAVGDTVHQAVVDGVTADYFPLLGVRVVEGRPLGSTDNRASASVHAVLDELGREFVLREDSLPVVITRALARERLLAGMAAVYGGLAIAMVAIGVWALLAQDVTRRRREFGVRLSLGASPTMLYRAVTMRGLRLTAAGMAVGMVLTWMLWRVLVSTIRVNGEGEPWGLVAVAGLLLIVVLCAAVGPARHAARTEPVAALRSE